LNQPKENPMNKRIIFIILAFVALQINSCVPVDDTVDPTDPVAKFLGDWSVTETCNRGNFSVTIEVDPGNSSQVLLHNFCNTGPGYDPAVGLVVSNAIHVSSQTIGEGWTVSGKGTYQSDGTINWDYDLIIPPNEESCSAIFSN
jgi:hypothetical protein